MTLFFRKKNRNAQLTESGGSEDMGIIDKTAESGGKL